MGKERKGKGIYRWRKKHDRIMLLVEILCTMGITVSVTAAVWNGLYRDAKQYTAKTAGDYQNVIENYITTFQTMLIPIKEKIGENPDFDEMQDWLQKNESEYNEALGTDVYDGIAFTYQGGYVHSWDYGDYSDYDPTERPWYQQAQEADGRIAVVAPYVTYLDSSYFNDGGTIRMTIAQKYTEEICFDLDLKLTAIKDMLLNNQMQYKKEQIILYDKKGYILSSTKEEQYAHNLYEPDQVITQTYSDQIKEKEQRPDVLQLDLVEGKLQYVYFHLDEYGNTICMMVPFGEVFLHNFLALLLISILLVLLEYYLYRRNMQNHIEFMERDRRLGVVADSYYRERVYIDVDKMEFYGNELAEQLCRTSSYEELYSLIRSRLANESEMPRLEAFLAPEVLKGCMEQQYQIISKRFMMNMVDKDGVLKLKTIEISRMGFTRNREHMVGVSMQDAAESADLLKAALKEAEEARAKEQNQKKALEDAFLLAKQSSQAKGTFLSKMSHEIRTPLNAIIGYLSIAKEEPEKVEHCIENSEIAAKHLLQIINDVLDMSSIESGRMKIANEPFDLKQEVCDITAIFYQNALEKGIRFETQIGELEEEWVVGDQLRLNQILMNLLSNAVKFTPEGGVVKLVLRQLNQQAEEIYIQFLVSDTGIGMSKEYMKKLFQPFEQESASTARKYGGSGLGLSITRNLIAMMGGEIDVKSIQDQGTTFTVTLHFGRTPDHPPMKVENMDYDHVRALIVDDEKDEGTYVRSMLKRCGVKADAVTSGREALKKIKSRLGGDYAYDLCILDWRMPEMNGVEVAARIREEFGTKMPLIIATAYDITELEDEAKAAGVTKVVSKPLFQSTIFNLLVSTFGKYDPEANCEQRKEKVHMDGVRVILAEDNEMNMEIAVTVLEKAGIVVDQAVNGQEAVDHFPAAAPKTYDLILMDIQMPVLDGYEATKKIRNSGHPEAETIPIIAMTANAFAEDVSKALASGMNAHIAKPVNYDKLFLVLKKFAK